MSEHQREGHPSNSSVWTASPELLQAANVTWLMQQVGVDSYDALHAWSVQNREAYWELVIERLGLRFQQPFDRVLDLARGLEEPDWLPGARLNIVESCFLAPPDSTAIVFQREGGTIEKMSVGELQVLAHRVAAGLVRLGFKPGDAIAVVLPMTVEAVAIYLGIIHAGCVVVGIAESFRPREIVMRLRLANAVAVFTQDVLIRGRKKLPLYANVVEAEAPLAIVLPAEETSNVSLRADDLDWNAFLSSEGTMAAVSRTPADHLNILFSSGTTGEPKAIPWSQTTPIKCAADAHFHQEIQPGDVLVWPTSLGWMMGPWLIFASLLNRATIGLYYGLSTCREFGVFVQDARATMLGVVPTLVKSWRTTGVMNDLDWSTLKLFSSTGECSSADDMQWLMGRGGGKPVIEYCGGTEIGGGYITGTIAKPCSAGTFNTPALGLNVAIVDDERQPADSGELFIVPPSIGLSTSLLNREHHEVYFADAPRAPDGGLLRRHGDRMQRLPTGDWQALGRADDTMNLGGIKVSSAEIEQVLRTVPGIAELAAIAVSPGGGPSQLVIFAVPAAASLLSQSDGIVSMQNAIRRDLNPLFKIHDLFFVDALPRTASNKIMRRTLRDQYRARAAE
ncbi:AMP-binding protein [Planctomicrobium piriforme]|uniref:Acetyl-CoA synthetase n=1 Tax=Planctomicrobium piriforme TaxID=1576369 RepID=A0A1I3SAS0_9PLAN|nr:AMP-binding protein [Planctomicrobium piriforme]SFJ55914.1 acetyl-CoA synthetase [Planctomicrobium piriforme]